MNGKGKKNAYTTGYYSAIKKKEILLFATTWVDPEGIMLREIGQKERKKKMNTVQTSTSNSWGCNVQHGGFSK